MQIGKNAHKGFGGHQVQRSAINSPVLPLILASTQQSPTSVKAKCFDDKRRRDGGPRRKCWCSQRWAR